MKYNKGFTLIELMIALVISSFVLLGITSTYSSIQSSIQVSKDLETAQEVIRYSSQVFTRSLKQTLVAPTIVGTNQIRVEQKANTRSCFGGVMAIDYVETFTFVQPDLSCRVVDTLGNDTNRVILTEVNDMRFAANGNLITIIVDTTELPQNFVIGGVSGVRIDISLTSLILQAAMPVAP
jgi:prepilin-type N-terminal cleavage/methylation domain-containing protein